MDTKCCSMKVKSRFYHPRFPHSSHSLVCEGILFTMSPGTTIDPNSLTLTVFSLLVTNYKSFPVFIVARRNTIKYTLPRFCLFFSIIYWTALVYNARYEYWAGGEFRAKLLGTRVQTDPACYCFSNWDRAAKNCSPSVGNQFLLSLGRSSWKKLKKRVGDGVKKAERRVKTVKFEWRSDATGWKLLTRKDKLRKMNMDPKER